MNKIIRTPRISEHRVVLSFEDEGEAISVEEASLEGFVSLDQQADTVDPDDLVVGVEEETDFTEEEEEPEPGPEITAAEIEAQVEERLQEFEARYQQEKEDAYRSGFEDGHREGLKEGQAQSASEIERFQSVVHTFSSRWEDLFKNTELDLADLAIAVAKNIIGSAAETHSEIVVQAIQDCLSYLLEASKVVLKIHPDDLEVVRSHQEAWLESLENVEHLTLETDPEIHRGGCLIETPAGDVDARIEERLKKLRNTLIESIQNTPSDESSLEQDEMESPGEIANEPDIMPEDSLGTPEIENNVGAIDSETRTDDLQQNMGSETVDPPTLGPETTGGAQTENEDPPDP